MRTKWLLIASPLVIFGVLAQSAFWVPSSDSQAKANPERLRTYLRAAIGDAKVLNPIIFSENAASEVMWNNVTEALIDADEDFHLVPRLAERWDTSEVAYLAVLPDRTLPDGSPVTAERLLALLDSSRKGGRLAGVESSILGLDLVPAESRSQTETVLETNAKGKQEPSDVKVTIAVPERVRIRLSKVEPDLFEQLKPIVGAGYFEKYPFASHFQLDKPALLPKLSERFPELLGIGEHNPVLTFHLRPGVRWHDGVPFTAEDVKFTYQALVDPRNASPRGASFEPIKSVEVLDELTARVTYKALYAPAIIDWLQNLIPKHLLDEAGLTHEAKARGLSPDATKALTVRTSNYNREPIGTGPFRLSEWRPDQFIRLARNEQYWGEKPEYRQIFYRVIPDYLTMELEFQAGALDKYDALPHQAQRYRNDPSYQVVSNREGYYSYIGYNLRRPLFQDVRVRRALGMPVDVDAIIKYVLSGEGKRATGPFYSSTPYGDPNVKPLPFDPEGALKLLEEVGWKKNARGVLEKDGKPFAFTLVTNNGNPQRKAIMTVAQEAWKRIGIDCKIQAFEWTVFIQDFVNVNQFDAIVLAWGGGEINPDKYPLWHSSQTDPYESNHSGYRSSRADSLLDRVRIEYDPQKQIELTRELHRLIAEDQPMTFLYEPLRPLVFDKRMVRVTHGSDGQEKLEKLRAARAGSTEEVFLKQWRKLATVPAPEMLVP
jgi:ABC-type transport system substrate-binding protein